MEDEPIRLSAQLAGIFSCFTLLIIGSVVLLKNMSLDYNVVLSACKFSIFGAVAAGAFGFYIGKILESANYSSSRKNNKKSSKVNKKVDDNINDEHIDIENNTKE